MLFMAQAILFISFFPDHKMELSNEAEFASAPQSTVGAPVTSGDWIG